MKRRGLLAAVLVGVLLGLMVVVGGIFVLERTSGGEPLFPSRAERGVLVALALPDAEGKVTAQVLLYYPPGGAAPKIVDPLTRTVVAGTSASTLGEALTFGGGAALARAYGELARVEEPSWVVIDTAAWEAIAGPRVSVVLPRPVDTFNGTELVSFPAGQVALEAADLGVLLAGTASLPRSERLAVLDNAAQTLHRALVSPGQGADFASSLSPKRLAEWRTSLATRAAPQSGSE